MRNINATQSMASDGSANQKDVLIDEVVEAFTSVRGRGARVFRRLQRRSMSMGHAHVLVRLQMGGPLPVSHLARSLGVSAASATGMVSRMEERGLVERVRDEHDRRVVLVRLAPGGQAALDAMGNRSRASLVSVLARLRDDELMHLRDGLRAFQRAAREAAEEDDARDDSCRETGEGPAGNDPAGNDLASDAERSAPTVRATAAVPEHLETPDAAEDPD